MLCCDDIASAISRSFVRMPNAQRSTILYSIVQYSRHELHGVVYDNQRKVRNFFDFNSRWNSNKLRKYFIYYLWRQITWRGKNRRRGDGAVRLLCGKPFWFIYRHTTAHTELYFTVYTEENKEKEADTGTGSEREARERVGWRFGETSYTGLLLRAFLHLFQCVVLTRSSSIIILGWR